MGQFLTLAGTIDMFAQILHETGFNPYQSSADDPNRARVQGRIADVLLGRDPDFVTIDYRAPVPGKEGPDPRWILPITMSELYERMKGRYEYRRAFPLMTDPPKTFLLYERIGRRQ